MRWFVLLMLSGLQIVFSQDSERRLSFVGGVGLADAKGVWPFYGVYWLGCNETFSDGRLISIRYANGSVRSTPDDDPENWSYRQFVFLGGLQKESKYAKVFVACGPGFAIHKYWPSAPPDYGYDNPYTVMKLGLAYEAGATLIPLSKAGIGVKVMGQFTTSGWSVHGVYLAIELGDVRKK